MKKAFFFFFLLPIFLNALVLEKQIKLDLEFLNIDIPAKNTSLDDILDVAIIGGGQAGTTLCFALHKHGISNVAVFDEAPKDLEGPWLTTARMLHLRSNKESLVGLALGIPNLTFRAWYEAAHNDWDALNKVPISLWTDYLHWYRDVLHLHIHNQWRLLTIEPDNNLFHLFFDNERTVRARKVVLATGRTGIGGFELPSFIENVPKSFYFHTGEKIDPTRFQGQTICVIGAAASAYDIAATALECGAKRVDMLMRREAQEERNYSFDQWPCYFSMSDEARIECFQKGFATAPPPKESVARAEKWGNFYLHRGAHVKQISCDHVAHIETSQGSLEANLIILATGYAVNLSCIPELRSCKNCILTWENRLQDLPSKIAHFPYLGAHFQFLEKIEGTAPYLKNIHCFNYGAYLSHGCISGDIDRLGIGAERLARGIATDLFLMEGEQH